MLLQASYFQRRHVAQEHIDGMKAGSVVVDLAAETGGNIETTRREVLLSFVWYLICLRVVKDFELYTVRISMYIYIYTYHIISYHIFAGQYLKIGEGFRIVYN